MISGSRRQDILCRTSTSEEGIIRVSKVGSLGMVLSGLSGLVDVILTSAKVVFGFLFVVTGELSRLDLVSSLLVSGEVSAESEKALIFVLSSSTEDFCLVFFVLFWLCLSPRGRRQ